MKDSIWKVRVLIGLLRATFYDWQREVWRRDPDSTFCCTPSIESPCGCYAATIREVYSHQAGLARREGAKT